MCERKDRAIFAPWKWSGSIVVWIGSLLTNILISLSPLTWIESYLQRRGRYSPLWLAEVWVIILLFLQAFILVYGQSSRFSMVVAIYGLLEVLGATLRDVVVAPQIHHNSEGSYIPVRDRLRWLLFVPLHIAEVILCFAILFLYYGNAFNPQIYDPLTALYQSALTFTTLGYGDFTPTDRAGQIIVSLELAFFIVFLAVKLPIAISVIRIKQQ